MNEPGVLPVALGCEAPVVKTGAKNKGALENLTETLEALLECVYTLSENKDFTVAVERLLKVIGEYYGADRAYIFEFQLERERKTMRDTYEWCAKGKCQAKRHFEGLSLSHMRPLLPRLEAGDIFRTHRENRFGLESEIVIRTLMKYDTESIIMAPLFENGCLIGMIGVDNPTVKADEFIFINSVSFFVANDITKRKQVEELRRLSYTDALTGLGNRGKYNQDLADLTAKPPGSLGVVFLDVNGLKAANDRGGHLFGDEMIVELANILKDVFENGIYRLGGDEFVVLCAGIGRIEFLKMIERLRRRISDHPFLEASVGSSYREGNVDIEKQVKHSDANMYMDKREYYQKTGNERRGLRDTRMDRLELDDYTSKR